MNEDDSKAFDLFGLSDIDRIQNDIERDLSCHAESAGETSHVEAPPVLFVEMAASEAAFTKVPANESVKPTKKTSWAKTAVILFLICTLGTGSLGFGLGTGIGRLQGENTDHPQVAERFFETTSFVFETVEEATVANLADMVELIVPSIVAITTHREESRYLPSVTHASGIIFAEDSERIFIATSWSVVRTADRWDVKIDGVGPISGVPVGSDRASDLAVMGVYKSSLLDAGISSVVIASFGNSGEMRVGDVVLAIGNAMGDGISVTRGIISATEDHFVLAGSEAFPPIMVLQTDAAINMGSSGGALINMRGEVVGININHATNQFGASPVEGMGYSISAGFAAPILNRMVFSPFPAIGIEGQTVNAEMAEILGIPRLGVFIVRVMPGRAACIAGIIAGDVITGFNGQPVFEFDDLLGFIRSSAVGDVVEVNILRDGASLVKQVELMYTAIDNF